MLLCLPVAAGVMRYCMNVLIKLISRAVSCFKVDVVRPVILGTDFIIVCKNIVAVLAGKIPQNFFIHNGDFTFDCSLTITNISLRSIHDRPATLSVTVPHFKI